MFDNLKKIFTDIVSFDDDEWKTIQNSFEFRTIPARTTIFKTGAISRELFFINKGLLRLYYVDESYNDITAFFFSENLFAGCYESFVKQIPGNQALETLEKSDVLVINYENLQKLYKNVPKINIITRVIAETRFINGQRILSSFILQTPEERYKTFMMQYPILLQRAPLQYIASFLGITPVSLSRIQKKIISKH